MEITSLTNKHVKEWVKLQKKKNRDEMQCFLIEGDHLIEEAIKQGIVKQLILPIGETTSFFAENIFNVTPEIMKKISTNASIPKMIAVCCYFELEPQPLRRIILLDGLQDPGNIGTIIRTAVSFEFDAVYLSLESVDRYNEKLIRATQGALFQIPILQRELHSLINDLKQEGFTIITTCLGNSIPLQSTPTPKTFALVFGSEGSGVSEGIVALSDYTTRIEMQGFESLNVAVAAGIVLYQLSLSRN